jgi:hypothetical protein
VTAGRLVALLEGGRAAWLLPPIAAALAVIPAAHWSVPDERGIPFALAWVVATIVLLVGIVGWRGRRPSAFETALAAVAAAAVVGDITLLPTQPLRDLDVYLRAGSNWLAGEPVYLDHLVTAVPDDRSLYPFHYPPLTLPFFGALAALPGGVIHVAWPVASGALALVALRTLGLAWPLALAALLWRPFAEGLWVGNVAVPLLAAFVLAPRAGALLAIPGLFKVYSAIPALWLVRERRWRDVAVAALLVLGLAAGTLPLVGLEAWRAWLTGLAWWDASIPALGVYASGIALAQWLGLPIALALAAGCLVLAVRAREVESLWRLGVVTPIASPAVFSHGLLTALPAILQLRPVAVLLALAATASTPGPAFWLAPALVIASWFLPALRADEPTARS